MYTVVIKESVKKQISKFPQDDKIRILSKIQALENNPKPLGFKKLKGRSEFRIRVGKYRIIYNIFDSKLLIEIVAAGTRGGVYE